MAKFDIASALKAQQWERAKGELRALVSLQGSFNTGDTPPNVVQEQTTRWQLLESAVVDFIMHVEDNGLHE